MIDHIQKIENQLHQQQNEVSFDRVTMSFSDTSCTLDGNDNHDTNNVNNSESMNAVNGYLLGRSPIVEVLDSNLLSSSVTSCTSSLSDFCDSGRYLSYEWYWGPFFCSRESRKEFLCDAHFK